MRNPTNQSIYRAYLLRCWQESDQWHYSLEKVGNGRRHGFASTAELPHFCISARNGKICEQSTGGTP